jgi:hypothetical protein
MNAHPVGQSNDDPKSDLLRLDVKTTRGGCGRRLSSNATAIPERSGRTMSSNTRSGSRRVASASAAAAVAASPTTANPYSLSKRAESLRKLAWSSTISTRVSTRGS